MRRDETQVAVAVAVGMLDCQRREAARLWLAGGLAGGQEGASERSGASSNQTGLGLDGANLELWSRGQPGLASRKGWNETAHLHLHLQAAGLGERAAPGLLAQVQVGSACMVD